MKRGGFGKPYRKPAGGWPLAIPPYSQCYNHRQPALNGLAKFVNTTNDLPLQQNQVGRPTSRPAVVDTGEYSCEQPAVTNGLPPIPWIGLGDNQYLLTQLPNKFTQNGTNDKGLDCRLRGGKWVQAVRQWHGSFGFLDPDASDCPDTMCQTEVVDSMGRNPGDTGYVATYSRTFYRGPGYTGIPTQSKFTTKAVNFYFNRRDRGGYTDTGPLGGTDHGAFIIQTDIEWTIILIGTLSVDPSSGMLTLTVSTFTATKVDHIANTTTDEKKSALALQVIADAGAWPSCLTDIPTIAAMLDPESSGALFPIQVKTNQSYSTPPFFATDTITYNGLPGFSYNREWFDPAVINGYTDTQHCDVTRTNTDYTFNISQSLNEGDMVPNSRVSVAFTTLDYHGEITLSGSNTSADVKADGENLLSYWPLNDDAIYPWRTDGIWQVAPLMSRDEMESNISLAGFPYPTADDLRAPIADANGNAAWTSIVNPPPLGWTYSPTNNDGSGRAPSDPAYSGAVSWVPTYTQMAWYDPSAYGFKFAFGRTVNDSAATDFLQYGLTGKILGMPMPTAFTSSESYWYNPDFPTPPLYHKYDYQNFFDYRAKLWKSCDHVNGDGLHSIDFYIAGYGEWLYDAITRTGALLPHCATQWTNNADACTKAPYAWLIQGDQQIYFSPPDTHANRADALWGQKCAEIQELWPSYDFARPAAGDKFIYDETHVYCVTNLAGDGNGSTWTLVDYKGDTPADGLDVSGTWGGQSVGGFYSGCSYAGGTLTLGTKVFDVPSDWKHALNADEGTCIGKLRYPTAPAILGRMNVVSVADIAASRLLVAGSLPDLGLDIPQAETVDICAADMTVLAGAVIPTRVKAWAASTAYTVGQVIIDGHGALQTCTTGGTSDASAPTWGISGTTTDASVTWTFTLAGSFAPDTTFTVPTALATIATAKYIVSHGATNYEWDDNARKLDFVTLEWLFNYRVPQEIIRLAGATDCSGASIALSPTTAGYLGFATFNQTQYENATALKFNPCCPSVICISPNAETWKNGVTIPFPATFNFDSRYGARWQMEIEQAMADLLWQTPAKPCGFASGDRWLSDDGTCQADAANDFGGTNKYYAHAPFVEARITVPNYGGNSETDTAPTPPTGIGYLSPVTDAGGLQPPGMIGFDIGSGNPNGAWTFWGYRINIEQSSCPPNSCRFSYADTENLPCKNLAVPTDPITDPTITGLGGLS